MASESVRERVSRSLYSALLRLALPAYLWKLWSRGRAEPLYRHAIGERFGRYSTLASSGWVWVHAVSLGETRAAAALIQSLRLVRPGMRLLLTHGTATGLAAGRELLVPGDAQTWLPIDTPGAVRRFYDHFEPVVGVLMETEIWPNLLNEARIRGLPMALANARLSERSLERGARFASVLQPAMSSLAVALAQTEADATRLRAAGVPRVEVFGNLKFDMSVDPALLERGRLWRAKLGRPVVLAAATREGEEAMLLEAWQRRTRSTTMQSLLLIVPRHPQRFEQVGELIRSAGLVLAKRSDWPDGPTADARDADAWIGDSMREMPQYYALADVALLGGSFAPLGGQNLIEAAACGCPLLMGPSTFNFDHAARLAEAAGAAQRCDSIDEALQQAFDLLDDPRKAARMRDAARGFAREHRGAAIAMAHVISDLADRGLLESL